MRAALLVLAALVVAGLFYLLRDGEGGDRSTARPPGVTETPRAVETETGGEDETPVRSVAVLVVDENDAPVPGARVGLYQDDGRLAPDTIPTDASGRCAILVTSDPWVGIGALHSGYVMGTEWIRADVREVTIVLHPGAPLTVIAVDPDRKPIAGVAVRVAKESEYGVSGMWRWSHSVELGAGTTGADGRARLGALPQTVVELTLDHPRYALRREMLEIRGTAAIEHLVVLDFGGAIEGRVTDPGDRPVPGARVSVYGFPRPTATARADGTYRLDGVGATAVQVIAGADGHGPGYFGATLGWDEALPVKVRPGAVVTGVDIRLGRATFVTGRVVDDAKQPLAGIRVHLYVDDTFPDAEPATTGAHGRFKLGPVSVDGEAEIDLRVEVSSGTFTFHEQDRKLRSGETMDVGDLVQVRKARVEGVVVGVDGAPASGVTVWIGSEHAASRTREDGTFEAGDIQPGHVWLGARSEGVASQPQRLTVGAGETKTGVELRLLPLESVAGRVFTPDGQPRDGVLLRIQALDGRPESPEDSRPTDAGGRFAFAAPPGRYRVGITGTDSASSWMSHREFLEEPPAVTVEAGREDLEFVLPYRGGVISGRVVSRHTGRPLKTFTASFLRYKLFLPQDADFDFYHDEKGRFRYETKEPGTWQAEFAADDHASHRTATFSLKAGEKKDLGDIRLGQGGTLAGVVVDAAGAPIPYARVNILNAKFQTNDTEPFTDREGRFELKRISPGPYTVFAVTTRHPLGMVRNVVVRDSETTDVVVKLLAPAPLTVVVTDPGGAPLAGAEMSFTFAAIAPLTSKVFRDKIPPGCGTHFSDEAGLIRQLCLPPGRITLTIEADGFVAETKTVRLKAGEANRLPVRLRRDRDK